MKFPSHIINQYKWLLGGSQCHKQLTIITTVNATVYDKNATPTHIKAVYTILEISFVHGMLMLNRYGCNGCRCSYKIIKINNIPRKKKTFLISSLAANPADRFTSMSLKVQLSIILLFSHMLHPVWKNPSCHRCSWQRRGRRWPNSPEQAKSKCAHSEHSAHLQTVISNLYTHICECRKWWGMDFCKRHHI